jgi:hypothetical protein
MPLLASADVRWPGIAAYAVTRLRPEASMWLQSGRGDPVVAAWQAGAGRVVAVTSGLGDWTPRWLAWNDWPDLAGGLADWVSGSPGAGRVSLHVSDTPEGLAVEADLQSDGRWAAAPQAALAVVTPGGRSREFALRPVAPGRLGATVPEVEPGAYTLVVSGPAGSQRTLHLREDRAEQDGWGESPDVERWVGEDLVRRWDPSARGLADLETVSATRHPDRWLVGFALLLFCAGVVVDRLPRGFGFR